MKAPSDRVMENWNDAGRSLANPNTPSLPHSSHPFGSGSEWLVVSERWQDALLQKLASPAPREGDRVPGRGLEPLRIAPPDPKSGASANFATPAVSQATLLKQFR